MKTTFFSLITIGFLILSSSCLKEPDINPLASSKVEDKSLAKSQSIMTANVNGNSINVDMNLSSEGVIRMIYEDQSQRINTPIIVDIEQVSQIISPTLLTPGKWRINIENSSKHYIIEATESSKDIFSCDLIDPLSRDTARIVFESSVYDLMAIPQFWDQEDIIPRSAIWGRIVAGLLIYAVGEVMGHCDHVITMGTQSCVAAGGTPQTGFCSVDCIPGNPFQ